MIDKTSDQWILANQRYLTAAIHVVQSELSVYLASLEEGPTLDDRKQDLFLSEKEMQQAAEALPAPAALDILVELFGLSSFEKKILLLCAGVELDSRLIQLLTAESNDPCHAFPTFSLALSAFPDAHWSAITPEGPLRYWNLVELEQNRSLTGSPLALDEQVLHYLTGINYLDTRLQGLLRIHPPASELPETHQQIAEQLNHYLSHFLEDGQSPIIQLTGNNLEDKLAIAAEAFAHFQLATFVLPLQLLPATPEELTFMIRLWNRAAAMNGFALFIDAHQWSSLDQRMRQLAAHFIEEVQGIAILGTPRQNLDIDRGEIVLHVGKPLKEEQKILWKNNGEYNGMLPDHYLDNLVTQFDLSAHTIRNLGQAIIPVNEPEKTTPEDVRKKIWQTCCQHTRPQLDELSQRIDPVATWDDLVLPEKQKTVLKAIGLHVKNRQKVYDDWGFAGKSTRGLGISALFSGESGTGKTMAAEVLANELSLDLYCIDLSQVVNKYIGETEKNLKKIFDAAEESGAILLFDEADALFGKRSEVKDSHDRYSNIEVSYLLQRMEAYRGLAILTTNMKKALDKAFMRRIRFVLHFPFPNADLRTAIWRKIFPEKTPVRGLDYKKLGGLHITGGNIKNIALNASFLAADANRAVDMQDLFIAAQMEYSKLDKQMSSSENFSTHVKAHQNIHR